MYPIMFKQLFDKVGFAWAVRISGFISLACCIVAVCTVTTSQPPVRREGPWLDSSHFRDIPFVLVISGSVFVCLGEQCIYTPWRRLLISASAGLFIPFFYIADYAQDHGLSANTAFYIISALNGGGIVGRLAPPLVSDVVGRFNVITPCAFLLGMSALVFWIFAKTLISILLFAILYGFLSGAFIAMLIPCVAQISEGVKLKEIGTRIGMLYSIVSFAYVRSLHYVRSLN